MGYLFLISCFRIGYTVHVETFDEKQKQACVEKKNTDIHVCIRNERKYLFLWKYFRFNSIRSILQYCEHT